MDFWDGGTVSYCWQSFNLRLKIYLVLTISFPSETYTPLGVEDEIDKEASPKEIVKVPGAIIFIETESSEICEP